MRIGPDDVGRRVVLRHRLPDGRATDVLGVLIAWDVQTGIARVITKRGEVVVPLADLLLGKRVPPPPAPRPRGRSRSALDQQADLHQRADLHQLADLHRIADLHRVMADGWQPLENADLGGWRLRAAQGFTGRANSVLPLGPPPGALADAVDQVEEWYTARSLPARFCVPWPLGCGPGQPAYGTGPWAPLERELVERGYELDTPTIVMTRSSSPNEQAAHLSAELAAELTADVTPGRFTVELEDQPDAGWLELYHYRGQELPPVAVHVLMSAPAQSFVSVLDGGSTIAVGRGASAQGWSGLSAIEVAPDYRGQRLGHVVVGQLLQWARERGDPAAYLQVAAANAVARALYARHGFTDHSGYHYRVHP